MSKTFNEELDEIILNIAQWQFESRLKAKQTILKLVEERIIGRERKIVSRPFKQHFDGVEKIIQKPVFAKGHKVREELRGDQRQRLYEGVEE